MWKRSPGIATALLLVASSPAWSANLVLTPRSVAMTLPAGESGATTVGASLNSPPTFPFSIDVDLLPMAGSLPSSWLTSWPARITHAATSQLLPLTIVVPASARSGVYTRLMQPVARNAAFPLAPPSGPLLVTLTVLSTCSAAPTITLAPGAASELGPPNGRIEDLVVTGSVSVPDGCTLRASYELEDEYGQFSRTAEISAATDGSFIVNAPIQVSRRGDDKDGRTYRVTVRAENEAGSATAATWLVTVKHDQRDGR